MPISNNAYSFVSIFFSRSQTATIDNKSSVAPSKNSSPKQKSIEHFSGSIGIEARARSGVGTNTQATENNRPTAGHSHPQARLCQRALENCQKTVNSLDTFLTPFLTKAEEISSKPGVEVDLSGQLGNILEQWRKSFCQLESFPDKCFLSKLNDTAINSFTSDFVTLATNLHTNGTSLLKYLGNSSHKYNSVLNDFDKVLKKLEEWKELETITSLQPKGKELARNSDVT